MKPELSVIIPVYNEEALISKTFPLILKEVMHCTDHYEIWLIDDGSTDQTWNHIIYLCEEYDHIYAIRLSRNFGKELALCAGLEHARGKAVIVMDADLQHPPSRICEMMLLWKDEGYDIVEGVKCDRGKESLRNKWGSAFFYFLLNKFSGYELRGASDFKLLDEKVVQAWREMPERATFFRGMTEWLGFNKTTIEFEVPERPNGASRWRFFDLVRLAVKTVVSFSSFPLRIVNLVGIAFLIGSILLGVQTLYRKIIGEAVTGFTTVILLQLVIGSVLMFSIGVIGEYISAIYNETKRRPRYIVGEVIFNRQPKESIREKTMYEV